METFRQRGSAENNSLDKDFGVRPETDGCSGPRLAGFGQLRRLQWLEPFCQVAAVDEDHTIGRAAAIDLYFYPPGESIHHRDSYAVQPARDFVTATAELAAGVQHGQDNLCCL